LGEGIHPLEKVSLLLRRIRENKSRDVIELAKVVRHHLIKKKAGKPSSDKLGVRQDIPCPVRRQVLTLVA